MDYESNVYYSPEKWGLEIVGEIEFSDGCYQFDTRVIWKNEKGEFFTARDSGCSCPTPFEDYNAMSDLETPTIKMLMDEISKELSNGYSVTTAQEAQTTIDYLRELGLK